MDGNFSDSSDQIENMVETTFRRMQNEYQSLLKTAIAHKDAQRYEKAGEVFAKAAKLLYSHQMDYTKVIKRYNDAAECFLRIKDGRAFNCYLSAIDIDVNKGVIEKAIENCFISGYKCDLELGDKYKAEELYKKGEELRHEHKLSHSCVITRFDKSKHGKDLNKALDIYEKVNVNSIQVRGENTNF
ncbi:hypothetical protein RF11_13600 [Thelohanellus kitauei]|uniref:Alpha-soluble NSF attachment protein n=1 Tax=Thelohanellus kitauei TaxID=669202 RepID=A0A0C2MGQ9_THEKT|nr:hypothetical protein RF11_13600 [Thelohanellus kitauei]